MKRLDCFFLVLLTGCHLKETQNADGSESADMAGAQQGAACTSGAQSGAGIVMTDRGAVKGSDTGVLYAYKGIPFAAPPVGALRFKPPTEHDCWSDVRDASNFGAMCTQLDDNNNVLGQEDCLTLNVWAPKGASGAPVLVYIHGGGNIIGSSSTQLSDGSYFFDGANLAQNEKVVVVTFNYRLNAAGWFSNPALDAESENHASGNYGTLDQIAALTWVQRNIAAFGGDPKKVLEFGESAGAVDACIMMTSPLAKGLFSAGLIESGGCAARQKSDVQSFGNMLVSAVGCDGASDVASCLRGVSAEALVKAIPEHADVAGKPTLFAPMIDGWAIPKDPLEILQAGEASHVPFVLGINQHETSKSVPTMFTDTDYLRQVKALFPTAAALVMSHYTVAEYGTARDAYVALTTDAKFICPTRQAARAAAMGKGGNVYRYYFTHAIENAGAAAKAFGAFHGLELQFVFDHLTANGYVPTAGETALATQMEGYWSRFAATGDPNGGSAVKWPVYDPQADSYLGLDDTIAAGAGIRTTQCDFWDSLTSTQ
jgi:para-nitrobenzyl esterase